MTEYLSEIEEAERAIEEGNIDDARKILAPLVDKNVAAAIRINSSFFESGMSEEEMDRIYVEGMFKAAELGDKKALYRVGVFYDLGECGVRVDKRRATEIFKELAEEGDAHCMWIYACERIWGRGSFPIATDQGLKLLDLAIELGSAEACITKADFYDKGEFGLDVDIEKRDELRKLAMQYDDTTYDSYA